MSFGDPVVSEPVDPELLKKMIYSVDITENNTPLRHRILSTHPIKKETIRGNKTMVTVAGKSVIIHDANDHAPIWLEPGSHGIDTIRELDPWTNEVTYVFD